jgi:cytochrome c biogenesis protein CcdA
VKKLDLDGKGGMPSLYLDTERERGRLWAAVAALIVPALIVVGLLFLVITLQSGLETGVSNLARLLPVGFAVAAGMAATVNPCGVLMLPSYALYQVGGETEDHSTRQRVARGVLISLVATAGFVSMFAIVGAIIAVGGQWLIRVFPYAGLLIGIAMLGLGVWLLVTGRTLGIAAASRVRANRKQTVGNAFLFGITYAIGSLSCTLPIFLVVIGGALGSDRPVVALGQFAGYALGMAIVLVATIVGTALFQQAASKWLNRLTKYVHRISALFLVGAGGYLVYYWVFIADLF